MIGDCLHCRAPEPLYGQIQHAWDCPIVSGRWLMKPLQPFGTVSPAERAELVTLARECENGWYALREERRRERLRAKQAAAA